MKLFILEIANNHNGSVDNAKMIIDEFAFVKDLYGNEFEFAFKLQYRDLYGDFIHEDYKSDTNNKYIKRFMDTRLTYNQFKEIKDYIKEKGFLTACTPFDEVSVDKVIEHDFDILKIASCSFNDKMLNDYILSKLSVLKDKNIKIIASTATATESEMVEFKNRFKKFSDVHLLHCIAEYPTPLENINLNRLDEIKEVELQNYYANLTNPDYKLGLSNHLQHEDALKVYPIAIAKGATIFERHISNTYANNYSVNKEQLKEELECIIESNKLVGDVYTPSEIELTNITLLKRGIYIKDSKFYSAFPNNNVDLNFVYKIKELIINSRLPFPEKFTVELSHHYGIELFELIGCAIVEMVNREYCKKYIIVLPGQEHPSHFHKKKEETFIPVFGDITFIKNKPSTKIDSLECKLNIGETLIINREEYHSFKSKNGGIFEEISTKHYKDDSYYLDESILYNNNRKTFVEVTL